jgi:hypothetical protein
MMEVETQPITAKTRTVPYADEWASGGRPDLDPTATAFLAIARDEISRAIGAVKAAFKDHHCQSLSKAAYFLPIVPQGAN